MSNGSLAANDTNIYLSLNGFMHSGGKESNASSGYVFIVAFYRSSHSEYIFEDIGGLGGNSSGVIILRSSYNAAKHVLTKVDLPGFSNTACAYDIGENDEKITIQCVLSGRFWRWVYDQPLASYNEVATGDYCKDFLGQFDDVD